MLRLESRVKQVEAALEEQLEALEDAKAQPLLYKTEDVADACGVVGAEPGSLALGETVPAAGSAAAARARAASGSSRRAPGGARPTKEEQRARDRVGGQVYSSFCAAFVAALAAALLGVHAPELPWERMSQQRVLWHQEWLANHMHVPMLLCLLYVVVVFGIQAWLRQRAAFDLKYPLALWSFSLAAFSAWGSLRTVPALFGVVRSRGAAHAICGDSRFDWLFNNAAGTWTVLFIYSKAPELIDTLFIVLRKKPLITLHWYHHITVLLFCFHSMATLSMNGLIFSSMNLVVHSFMYAFYGLTALGYRPTQYALYITLLQIAQMLLGSAVALYVAHHEAVVAPQDFDTWTNVTWAIDSPREVMDGRCKVHPGNAWAGFCMYASYLYLFCTFFFYTYVRPRKGAAAGSA